LDHSPVLITLLQRPQIIKHPYRLTSLRTNRLKYKMYVSFHIDLIPPLNTKNDIQYCVDALESALVAAAKASTPQKTSVQPIPN